MEARGKRCAFSKARWARSVRPRRRQLPQGPSVWAKMAPREGGHASCRAGPPRPRTAVEPVNNYVHVKTADLYRPNARLTPERQGYQVLTPFGKLGYSHVWSIRVSQRHFGAFRGFAWVIRWESPVEARGKHAAFSKARWARSVRPRCRQLPQGPSVCDKMTPREGVDRPVLGLLSTGEPLCSPQNRRPVQAERSIYPGKTAISGTYAIWETRI